MYDKDVLNEILFEVLDLSRTQSIREYCSAKKEVTLLHLKFDATSALSLQRKNILSTRTQPTSAGQITVKNQAHI